MKKWFREYKKALKMLEVEEVFDLIIYRPLAFLLVKIVYPTNITPNQLTLIAVFFGVLGGICYGIGEPNYFFIGGILFILYDVFDCSDGQLARIKRNGTKTGRIIDGVADYIATIAAYIGIGVGFASLTDDPVYYWGLTVLAGASSAVLSILLDYYRNRFLDVVLERESVLESELREFTEEYARIKEMKGKYFDKALLKVYLKYSNFQVKMAKGKEEKKKIEFDSRLYYKKNKTLIHLWTYLGPTTQLTFMIVCSLINRMEIYLYGMITIFPVYALIIYLMQNSVDKEIKNKRIKMKAVILAAGIASRLRPLTDNTPKCLLEVGDNTILGQTLDNLIKNNITDLVIVTGYLQEQIKDYIALNYPQLNVEYLYNEKYESTNNIYSLWMTKERVVDGDFILLDSDILFDHRIVGQLLDSNYENCLAVKSNFELGEEEIKVTLDPNGCITEISKTVDPKLAIGESIGIEKFSNDYVKQLFTILDDMIINKKQVNIFYEAAFERSLKEGAEIYTVDVGEYPCMELDTAEDIEAAKLEVVDYIN